MADDLIWVIAKSRGQSPDRVWHDPEDGPFQIPESLFSRRWMVRADVDEVSAAVDGAVDMDDMSDEQLRDHYAAVTGEKARSNAKRETLIERITEKLNED